MKPGVIALLAAALLLVHNTTKTEAITGTPKRQLKRTRWFRPYKKSPTGLKPRPTLPNKYYKRAGTYVIRSRKTGRVIYVGYSANNLKRTLYRHFQRWNDPKQPNRYTYDPRFYDITIYKVNSRTAPKLEKALIKKYNPPDNKFKYPSLFDSVPDLDTSFFSQYSTTEEPF